MEREFLKREVLEGKVLEKQVLEKKVSKWEKAGVESRKESVKLMRRELERWENAEKRASEREDL